MRMDINIVTAIESYGPFKRGSDYKLLSFGRDWYRISVNGKVVHCPSWVFE